MTGKDNSQQQDTNTQASQQSRQPVKKLEGPTIRVNGEDVPFYGAPRAHSSESISRLAVRAREQSKSQEPFQLPMSATPEGLAATKFVPMPAGGLSALADTLFPDDINNQDAMDEHLFDLLTLNRDTLRDDTSYIVGQMVRVPA